MICVNCGKEIPFGEKICKYCKQDTEFEKRFRHQPESVPIGVPGSMRLNRSEQISRGEDTELMKQILGKLGELYEKMEHLATRKALKKVIPVNVIIGLVVMLASVLGSVLSAKAINGRVQAEMYSLSQQVTAVTEAQGESTAQLEALFQKEAALEEKVLGPKKYVIAFDLSLPEEMISTAPSEPAPMTCYPGDETALYLPKMEDCGNFRFIGWQDEESGIVAQPGEAINWEITGDITLLAKWETDMQECFDQGPEDESEPQPDADGGLPDGENELPMTPAGKEGPEQFNSVVTGGDVLAAVETTAPAPEATAEQEPGSEIINDADAE